MRVISHIYGFIMERSHGFWKIVIFIWYYSNLVNNQFLGSCRTWQNQSIEVFYKIAVLKNFAIFAGRYLWWSLFKKGLQFSIKNTLTEVFSCKYCKILMKICLIDICKWLLVTWLWFYWDRWDPHLKTMWPFKNNPRDQIFWKTNISYPLPDTITYVCISGVRNVGAMVNPQCTLTPDELCSLLLRHHLKFAWLSNTNSQVQVM